MEENLCAYMYLLAYMYLPACICSPRYTCLYIARCPQHHTPLPPQHSWYPRPQLRYPASNDKGLWAYNPECLQRCNFKLPSTFGPDIQTSQPAVQTSG